MSVNLSAQFDPSGLSDPLALGFAEGLQKVVLLDGSDDFDDGVRGWQWDILGTASYVSESGGTLNVVKTDPDGGGGFHGYEGSGAVSSDVDFQVDYAASTTGQDFVSVELRFYIDADNFIFIREALPTHQFQGGVMVGGVLDMVTSPTTPGTGMGRLRLIRAGGNVEVLYAVGSGDWVSLHTVTGFPTSAGKARLTINCPDGRNIDVSYDNFIGGGWYPPTGPTAKTLNVQLGGSLAIPISDILIPSDLLAADDDVAIQYSTDGGISWNGTWLNLDSTAANKLFPIKAGQGITEIICSQVVFDLKPKGGQAMEAGQVELHGLNMQPVGASCDYPAPSDVVQGVTYDNGSQVGTFSCYGPPISVQKFEDIEDKIIETLKAEVPYLRTVETYAGQLEGEIQSLPVQFPAVFVAYGGSEFDLVDGPSHAERVEFKVLCCARNLRGREAARKDAQGAYDIVADVLSALANRTFGLQMERLRPVKTELVMSGRAVAVYGVRFQSSFDSTFQF